MRGTWDTTRCAAPVRSRGGVLRCISSRCDDPTHARWRRATPLLAVVWWLKPWWPNRIGWLQDRGRAHTCPYVMPCRFCARIGSRFAHYCGDPTCREDHR